MPMGHLPLPLGCVGGNDCTQRLPGNDAIHLGKRFLFFGLLAVFCKCPSAKVV